MTRSALLIVLATALAAGLAPRLAAAQQAELQVDREAYAGLPFDLAIVAAGFDEEPAPTTPALVIAGARVTYLGVSPSVRSMTTNFNGRIAQRREVTFVYRYRVDAPTPGRYEIPPALVEQGAKRVVTRGAAIVVADIPRADDMRIELVVPERGVWVGETFTAYVDWYLRRDVDDHSLVVPMFDMEERFQIESPGVTGRQGLTFMVGSRELDLPYEKSDEVYQGQSFTRFRFTALVTPLESGTIPLPGPRAVAKLQVGVTRDRFGFRVPKLGLFKAEGAARTLEVRPLPLADRPPSFAGAVGSSFSIAVKANRTVVAIGEPIQLEILVRGDARLEGLSLPDLAAAGLDPAVFEIADDQVPGELVPEQSGKRFELTARLGAPTDRIPPLSFAYFDPSAGVYRTVTSEAIALSVKGSTVVGAGQVVSATSEDETPTAARAGLTPGAASGADLSLSAPAATLAKVTSVGSARPALLALYLVPLVALGFRLWQTRTRARRDERSEVRDAEKAATQALSRADAVAARDAVGPIVTALKQLARLADQPPRDGVIERLETEAFAPSASDAPLPAELLADARVLARRWADAARARPRPGAAAVLVAVGVSALLPSVARAEPSALEAARARYTAALALSDRSARTDAFADAAALFAELVAAHPDRPELLVDWGNAALGAGDRGTATLAYRRALARDATNRRARQNLAWLRDHGPAWLPPAEGHTSTVSSFFFWHDAMTRAHKHILGAVAFALGALLLAPWSSRPARNRLYRRLAIAPFAAWLGLTGSALLERDASADAVVVAEDVVLRAADSAGAPAALDRPVPAGTEVVISERRDGWTQVRFANGLSGWVRDDALASVAAPR